MPYSGSWLTPSESRFIAAAQAIVPAAIGAGAIGTVCLMTVYTISAVIGGALSGLTIEDWLGVFVSGGMALAFGTMALAFGTFAATLIVGFYLALFGMPVAVLMGQRIRSRAGLAVALATSVAGIAIISMGDVAFPFAYAAADKWQHILIVSCFAVPAAWLYRQQVIAMLDWCVSDPSA
jgi:hypothetical protein